jgi:hypothetical protein
MVEGGSFEPRLKKMLTGVWISSHGNWCKAQFW